MGLNGIEMSLTNEDFFCWKKCILVNDRYLYCGTGRVLQVNEFVSIVLESVHFALVRQQAVVLEVLIEIKSKWGYLCR